MRRTFLVEPATMSQRLVRAKARIRDAGLRFSIPAADKMSERLGAVLDAIHAAFGQGWDSLDLPDAPEAPTGEAIWLARLRGGPDATGTGTEGPACADAPLQRGDWHAGTHRAASSRSIGRMPGYVTEIALSRPRVC
jgi:hypothetical protein